MKRLTLKSLTDNEIDLIPLMLRIEIYEDIYSNFLLAKIAIHETESITETLPITGNEFVIGELEIHGAHKQSDKLIEFELDVSKVDSEQRGEFKQNSLELHLISRNFKKNVGKRNRSYQKGKADFLVEKLCLLQLDSLVVRTDPCDNEEEYIFPNWHPIGCINHLARNAISAEYGDPRYLFYEDLEGFHFVSFSYMMDPGFEQIYPTEAGMVFRSTMPVEFSPERGPVGDFNVEDWHKKHAFDVVHNSHIGMYGTTMIYHDIVNNKWREEAETYESTFGNFFHNAPVPLHEFITEDHQKNRFIYVPMNGVENPGPYQDEFYIKQRKDLIIRQMQLEQNVMVLEINGEPEMRVGRPLDFEYKSIKGPSITETEQEKLTGMFLVTKIRHVFEREFYRQFVEMTKDTFTK